MRGNVTFSSDSTNQNATTRYVWDGQWNVATRMVPPLGDSVVMGYDQVTGNRLWQQDARGPMSRVTYTYWTSGNKNRLLRYVDPPPAGQPYEYDYVGTLTNLTSVKTPLGIQTRVAADAWGRDTLTVAPIAAGTDSTRTWTFYDGMDRVTRTQASSPAVTYTFGSYLHGDWPAEVLVVTNQYDAEGNLLVNQRYVDSSGVWKSYMQTTHTYDRANRQTAVKRPQFHTFGGTAIDSTVYDPAGNAVRSITPRGHTITMKYDSLDRLIQRVVPQVDYAQAGCSAQLQLVAWCQWLFPFSLYANNGTGLRIYADTASFTYDAMGNLLTANNRYAQVRRTYRLDGSLATDSLRLRDYGGTSFNTHKYGLAFHYDLDGRRDTLYHPTTLAPSQKYTQVYQYAAHGAVSEVRNVFGNRYRFFYDSAGRLDSLAFPGGWEASTYDNDGRRTQRVERAGSTDLHDDDWTYDQRGRISTASGTGGLGWNVQNVYTGSGQLFATDMAANGGLPEYIEEYQTDGLSNVGRHRVYQGVLTPESAYEYDDISSLLERIVALEPPPPYNDPLTWRPDTTYNLYDEAGNVRYTGWRHYAPDPGGVYAADRWAWRGSASFFGADGKLMVQQVYRDSVNPSLQNRIVRRGMYEEYWYDALGRRVLVRRRGEASDLCVASSYCLSSIERFVWDGDQVLWELRQPGGDALQGTALDQTPPYQTSNYQQFGRTFYTHGPGLDAPLDLTRMDYNGVLKVVLPHKNWRGMYDAGTDTTGTVMVNDLQFPAGYRDPWHNDPEEPFRDRREWFGSLIQDKADETGLIYMRNRYYDPATGKFTQEDPIGLAGGLNLYGFAAGDPVNFGDPFGLCPERVGGDGKSGTVDDCPKEVKDAWAKEHIHNTSDNNTDIAGVDERLMGAVVLTSMDFGIDIGISGGREVGHSREGRHAEGGAVDINRIGFAPSAPVRFANMSDELAATVGNLIGASIANRLPEGSLRMLYTPGMAVRTNRAMTTREWRSLQALHRSHIHITVNP